MVPVEMSALEHNVSNDGKDRQGNALLYDLQLNEVERSSILHKPQAVGWYLAAVFKKCYHP